MQQEVHETPQNCMPQPYNPSNQQFTKSSVNTTHLTLTIVGNQHSNPLDHHFTVDIYMHMQQHKMQVPCLIKTRHCLCKCPLSHPPDLAIQIINFIFTNERFIDQTIQMIEDKFNPLIDAKTSQGWKFITPITINTILRVNIHTNGFELFKTLQIPQSPIKNTMKKIHQIAIQHLMYLMLNKIKFDFYPPPLYLFNGYSNNITYMITSPPTERYIVNRNLHQGED